MVLKVIWRKFKLYKRFGIDIWGKRLVSVNPNISVLKLFNTWAIQRFTFKKFKRIRFIYRIDTERHKRFFFSKKKRFVTHRVARLFYLTLSYLQFRLLLKRASSYEGSLESNYIMILENRLVSLLYRMQINMNIFELRWFVYQRKVFVDNKIIDYTNASVQYFSIIRFNKYDKQKIKNAILARFKRKLMYFNIPRYLVINYKLLFAFVFKEPKRKDIKFPIKIIDIYRGADYR